MKVNFNRDIKQSHGQQNGVNPNIITFPSGKIKNSGFLDNVDFTKIRSGSDLYKQLKQTNAYPLEVLKTIIYEKASTRSAVEKNEMIKKIYSCIVEISSIIAKDCKVNISLKHDLVSFRRDCVLEMTEFFYKNCNPETPLSPLSNMTTEVTQILGINSAEWRNSIAQLHQHGATKSEIENEIDDGNLSEDGTNNAWGNKGNSELDTKINKVTTYADSSSSESINSDGFFGYVLSRDILFNKTINFFNVKIKELKNGSSYKQGSLNGKSNGYSSVSFSPHKNLLPQADREKSLKEKNETKIKVAEQNKTKKINEIRAKQQELNKKRTKVYIVGRTNFIKELFSSEESLVDESKLKDVVEKLNTYIGKVDMKEIEDYRDELNKLNNCLKDGLKNELTKTQTIQDLYNLKQIIEENKNVFEKQDRDDLLREFKEKITSYILEKLNTLEEIKTLSGDMCLENVTTKEDLNKKINLRQLKVKLNIPQNHDVMKKTLTDLSLYATKKLKKIEEEKNITTETFKTTIKGESDLYKLNNLKHEITRFCDENELPPDELINLLHDREKEVVNTIIDEILKQNEDENKYIALANLGKLLTKNILKDGAFNELLTANNNSALKKLFGEDFKIQNMNKLANTKLEKFKQEKASEKHEEQRKSNGKNLLEQAIEGGIPTLNKLKEAIWEIGDTLGTYRVDDESLQKLSSLLKIDEQAEDSGVSKYTTIEKLFELIDKKVAALTKNAEINAEKLLREEDEAREKAGEIQQLKKAISEAVTKEGLFPEKLNDINHETLTIGELNLKENKLKTIKKQLKLKKDSSINELTFNQLKALIIERFQQENYINLQNDLIQQRINDKSKTTLEKIIELLNIITDLDESNDADEFVYQHVRKLLNENLKLDLQSGSIAELKKELTKKRHCTNAKIALEKIISSESPLKILFDLSQLNYPEDSSGDESEDSGHTTGDSDGSSLNAPFFTFDLTLEEITKKDETGEFNNCIAKLKRLFGTEFDENMSISVIKHQAESKITKILEENFKAIDEITTLAEFKIIYEDYLKIESKLSESQKTTVIQEMERKFKPLLSDKILEIKANIIDIKKAEKPAIRTSLTVKELKEYQTQYITYQALQAENNVKRKKYRDDLNKYEQIINAFTQQSAAALSNDIGNEYFEEINDSVVDVIKTNIDILKTSAKKIFESILNKPKIDQLDVLISICNHENKLNPDNIKRDLELQFEIRQKVCELLNVNDQALQNMTLKELSELALKIKIDLIKSTTSIQKFVRGAITRSAIKKQENKQAMKKLDSPSNNFLGVVGLYPVTEEMKEVAQNTSEYLRAQEPTHFDTYATNLLRCEDQFDKTMFDDLAAKLVLGYISTAHQQLSSSPKVSLLASKLSPKSKKQISTARFIQLKETSINLAESFEKASNLEENKQIKDDLTKKGIKCDEFKHKIIDIMNSKEVKTKWEEKNSKVSFREKGDNYYNFYETEEYYTPEFIAIINFLSSDDILEHISDKNLKDFVDECKKRIPATSNEEQKVEGLEEQMSNMRKQAYILKNEDPSIEAYNKRDISQIQNDLFRSIADSKDHELKIELNSADLKFEIMNLETKPETLVSDQIIDLNELIENMNTQFNKQFETYFGQQDLSSETLFEYFTQNPNATVDDGDHTYAEITKRFLDKFSDNGQRFLQDYMYPVIVAKIQLQYLEGKKGVVGDHLDEMKFVKSPASITQLSEFNFEPEVLQKLIALFMHGLDTRYPKDKAPTLLSRQQLLAISQMQKANEENKTVTVNLNAGEGKTFLSVLIDELINQQDKPIIHIAPFAQDEPGWSALAEDVSEIMPGKHYWIKAQDMSGYLKKEDFKQMLQDKSPYIYCDEFDRYPDLNKQLDHAHLYARCNMSATDNIQEVNVKFMESIAALQFIKENIPTTVSSVEEDSSIKTELQSIIDLAKDKSKLKQLNDKIEAFITNYTDALSQEIGETKKFKKLFKLLKKIPDLITRTNDKIDFELGDGPTTRQLNLHKAEENAITNFDQMLKASKDLFKKGKKLQFIFQGGEFVDGTERLTTKNPMEIGEILSKIKSKIKSETPPVYVHLLAPKGFKEKYRINEGHPVTVTFQDEKWEFQEFENYSHKDKEQGISITLYDTFNKVGGDFELDSQEVDYQGIYFQNDSFLKDAVDLSKEVITKSLLFQMVKRDRPGAKHKVASNLYIPASDTKEGIKDQESLLDAVSGNETSISGAVLENRKKLKKKRKLKKLFETTFDNFYKKLEGLSDKNKEEFLKLKQKIQEDIMLQTQIPDTFKEIFSSWNKEIEDKFDELEKASLTNENQTLSENIITELGANITNEDFKIFETQINDKLLGDLIKEIGEEIIKVEQGDRMSKFNEFLESKKLSIESIIKKVCEDNKLKSSFEDNKLKSSFEDVIYMFLNKVETEIRRGEPVSFERKKGLLKSKLNNEIQETFNKINATDKPIESKQIRGLKDKDLFNQQHTIMTSPNSTDFDLSYRFNRANLYCEFDDLTQIKQVDAKPSGVTQNPHVEPKGLIAQLMQAALKRKPSEEYVKHLLENQKKIPNDVSPKITAGMSISELLNPSLPSPRNQYPVTLGNMQACSTGFSGPHIKSKSSTQYGITPPPILGSLNITIPNPNSNFTTKLLRKFPALFRRLPK